MFGGTLLAGILVIAPVYLGVLLLLKAIKSLAVLLKPFVGLLPDWLPGDQILSLVLRVFELVADRLQADVRMMHEAIDEVDRLRAEVRWVRKEILAARE